MTNFNLLWRYQIQIQLLTDYIITFIETKQIKISKGMINND